MPVDVHVSGLVKPSCPFPHEMSKIKSGLHAHGVEVSHARSFSSNDSPAHSVASSAEPDILHYSEFTPCEWTPESPPGLSQTLAHSLILAEMPEGEDRRRLLATLAVIEPELRNVERGVLERARQSLLPKEAKHMALETMRSALLIMVGLARVDGWDELAATVKVTDQKWGLLLMGGTYAGFGALLSYGSYSAVREMSDALKEHKDLCSEEQSSSSDKKWSLVGTIASVCEPIAFAGMAAGCFTFAAEQVGRYYFDETMGMDAHEFMAAKRESEISTWDGLELAGCGVMIAAQAFIIANALLSGAKRLKAGAVAQAVHAKLTGDDAPTQLARQRLRREAGEQYKGLALRDTPILAGQGMLMTAMTGKIVEVSTGENFTSPAVVYTGVALTVLGVGYGFLDKALLSATGTSEPWRAKAWFSPLFEGEQNVVSMSGAQERGNEETTETHDEQTVLNEIAKAFTALERLKSHVAKSNFQPEAIMSHRAINVDAESGENKPSPHGNNVRLTQKQLKSPRFNKNLRSLFASEIDLLQERLRVQARNMSIKRLDATDGQSSSQSV